MLETYYAGVYWFDRKQSPLECARDTCTFLKALATCDPCFETWVDRKRIKRKWTTVPLKLEVDELAPMFAEGGHRRDGLPIEDMGYRIILLTPDLKTGPSVNLKAGSYCPAVHNSCVLSLPGSSREWDRVITEPVMANIMRCMVRSWDPDCGIATSYAHLRLVEEEGDRMGTGWIMYFSRRWGTVPPLPAPVRIEPIADKGTLIVLTPERLTASNPAHVELGRQVRKLLARAGLLDWEARQSKAPGPGR